MEKSVDRNMMKKLSEVFKFEKQAPWRSQVQWIGLLLAGLLVVVLLASMYMIINTRTALAGREISFAKRDIINIQHQISDLQVQVASQSSTQSMQARAAAMGFVPATPDEFMVIVVPGYIPRQVVNLGNPAQLPAGPIILPAYTQSLFDWLINRGTK